MISTKAKYCNYNNMTSGRSVMASFLQIIKTRLNESTAADGAQTTILVHKHSKLAMRPFQCLFLALVP